MSELIPAAIAAHLIDAKMRLETANAQHLVLHEAVALLIGDLHRRGLTDAMRLADQLEAAHGQPEVQQLAPQAASAASVLAGRIRAAALEPLPAGPAPTASA